MRPGSHATDDGSFGRSAGIQAGRAAVLIGVAVLIGFLLLHHVPGGGGGTAVSAGSIPTTPLPTIGGFGGSTTNTTARPSTSTTSSVPLRAPADIKVLVANGTSKPGLAGTVSAMLHAKGYATLTSTNSSQKPSASIVYFQPSYGGDAASLATKLNLRSSAVLAMPQPPPVANLNGANILVVVGPDLANTSSTTSTT